MVRKVKIHMPWNILKTALYARLFALVLFLSLGAPAVAGVVLTQSADDRSGERAPRPGTLIIPGKEKREKQAEEKCMTVCARWGEECVYVNRGAGGTTRKCRRTCKQFTEECF